ncbi:hypothetical protein K439DRAFT_1330749, partial [Ramaria rubella]
MQLRSTNFFPNPSECEELKKQIKLHRYKLESLDTQEASLIMQLAELKSLQADLRQFSAVAKGLMAPIRRLPTEILSRILTYAIPELSFEFFRDNYPYCPFGSPAHPTNARNRLREVCYRWSTLIDATPQIWSTIAL